MKFLKYIDNLRQNHIISSNIENDEFIYYTDILVEVTQDKIVKVLCIKKNYLTFCLVSDDGIKINVSDFDIILILLYLLQNYKAIGEEIINKLKEYLTNTRIIYNYKINDRAFRGQGIPVIDMDDLLLTKEDQTISLNDYIVILNMILEKERESKTDNDNNAIAKYLSFINYYHYGLEEYKKVLIDAGYHVHSNINDMKGQINISGRYKKIIDYNHIKNILI